MNKLIELEWRKLEQNKVFGEVIVYWVILMVLPVFLLKIVFAESAFVDFGHSYSDVIPLMLAVQMGFILFGASLINHVFIEEYKNKTMSLSFGYPVSRKKLVTAKVLFIVLAVFVCTLISFVLSGIATYVFDQLFYVIRGELTMGVIMTYTARMIVHSAVVALISLVPLFLFGIWKRAVLPTVICAVFLMQFPNFAGLLHITLSTDTIYAVMSMLGMVSVYLSVALVNRLGDI
ncbi:ABC transporter permease [Paenibacillus thermotolerans]|uniref:ABC transporter permease n=1 Tax=Paenibacillus thermotolerans TaxID=3027807 RepID=UPI00236803CC|nr:MULTISPECIES: ABC transporter permease [unclassified Paenibacillus]